jgi:hypothetical protein
MSISPRRKRAARHSDALHVPTLSLSSRLRARARLPRALTLIELDRLDEVLETAKRGASGARGTGVHRHPPSISGESEFEPALAAYDFLNDWTCHRLSSVDGTRKRVTEKWTVRQGHLREKCG